ncbi:MAG TPA: hypothetical protein VF765_05310 [Polyangiaceae bacterium]
MSEDPRFLFLPASEVGPYVEGLRAIERATEYPIADGGDTFTIDHGTDYTRFFTMLGHDARFTIALRGERVVGGVVGIARHVRICGKIVQAVYGADMKLAPGARGTGIGRKMAYWSFGLIFRHPELFTWRYAYAAAMRGAKGDVMRSTRGVHPARLAGRAAALAVYFVEPERLARLSLAGEPPVPDPDAGVDLSFVTTGQVEPPGMVSTAGRKDLRLRSTGQPWPLVHLPLGPTAWNPSYGGYLKGCGEALAGRKAIACFALDERMESHISWLAGQGIERGAVCSVYALDLTLRGRRAKWLHLATSEI